MCKKICKWLLLPVALLIIIVLVICVWNRNRAKSMWETNCNRITIENNGKTVTLNWVQRQKVIKFCKTMEDFDGNIPDEYDVIIDFHNDIVVLYLNMEEKSAVAKVCVGDSANTAYNYCKISDEFYQYIHNMLEP